MISVEKPVRGSSATEKQLDGVGRLGIDVYTIWNIGETYVVGIFMGYYGTCYLFRYVRYGHGGVRVFCSHKAGNYNFEVKIQKLY